MFSQRHILTAIKLSVSKDKDADGEVSQFGALVTSLAATIGTGNIVGVGTADIIGGVKNIARVCTARVPFRTIISQLQQSNKFDKNAKKICRFRFMSYICSPK